MVASALRVMVLAAALLACGADGSQLQLRGENREGLVLSGEMRKVVRPPTTCVSAFRQCGGKGWAGATCCTEGVKCVEQNVFFAQCIPDHAATCLHAGNSGCGAAGSRCCAPSSCVRPSVTSNFTFCKL
jgi:hypothetical protein